MSPSAKHPALWQRQLQIALRLPGYLIIERRWRVSGSEFGLGARYLRAIVSESNASSLEGPL